MIISRKVGNSTALVAYGVIFVCGVFALSYGCNGSILDESYSSQFDNIYLAIIIIYYCITRTAAGDPVGKDKSRRV